MSGSVSCATSPQLELFARRFVTIAVIIPLAACAALYRFLDVNCGAQSRGTHQIVKRSSRRSLMHHKRRNVMIVVQEHDPGIESGKSDHAFWKLAWASRGPPSHARA